MRRNSTLHGVVFAIFCRGPAAGATPRPWRHIVGASRLRRIDSTPTHHVLVVLLDQASPTSREYYHSGSSGSRRALRLAVVAEAEVVERTKLQRIEEAC